MNYKPAVISNEKYCILAIFFNLMVKYLFILEHPYAQAPLPPPAGSQPRTLPLSSATALTRITDSRISSCAI